MRDLDDITAALIDAAIHIHRDLGPGCWNQSMSDHGAPRQSNGSPRYMAQRLTDLRLMNKRIGLLINFGGNTLSEGLHRVVNHSLPPRLRGSA